VPDWISLLIQLWPIASTITPVILLAGFLWLRQKFPSKEDFDALKLTVDQLKTDQAKTSETIKELKGERDDPPTRVQLMAEMAVLASRVSGMEAGLEGVRGQLETSNDYLQILIERGVR
jgi:H+/Cl- antiporter ClcA